MTTGWYQEGPTWFYLRQRRHGHRLGADAGPATRKPSGAWIE